MTFERKIKRALYTLKPEAEEPREDDDLVQLVAELRASETCPLFWHTENERRCSKVQGARRKAKGVTPGIPDLIFASLPPRALELKRKTGGRLSGPQRKVLGQLRAAGWETRVAEGLDEARAVCREWGFLPQASPAIVEDRGRVP